MNRLVLAIMLVGCGTPVVAVDASAPPSDAFVRPRPQCVPGDQNPTCEPVDRCANLLLPRCPLGYTPVCSDGRAAWSRNSDGDCFVRGRWVLECDEAGEPECDYAIVCLPNAMGCGSSNGF